MVALPWITRFPWCPASGLGWALPMPPGWYPSTGRTRYTPGLRYGYILVDQETLIRFMADIWGTDVSERNLNVLEFYGLLIPARKAIVDDLWLRPTDLAYWQVLSHISPARAAGGLCENTRPSVGLDALLADESAFRLSAKQAERGNHLITRFYAIGYGERSSTNNDHGYRAVRLGIGPGQDWYLAALLERLRARFGAATAAELMMAAQPEKTNKKRAPYEALRERAEGFREREHFRLPPLCGRFYRYILLRLAHENRPAQVKADQSFKKLAKASGLKFWTIRKYVQRGGKLLRGVSR